MFNLRDREWQEFLLSTVFSINSTSSGIDKITLNTRRGQFPYITRSNMNNGINCFVCEQKDYCKDEGNCITVGLDTQTAFYQPVTFYTGQNIQVLRNDQLNAFNAQFVLPLLRNLMTIFSWGSTGATLTRLKRGKIILPSDRNDKPDWQFMEDYIREREQMLVERYCTHVEQFACAKEATNMLNFRNRKWREFQIGDLFIVTGTTTTHPSNLVKGGTTPRITCAATNNGFESVYKNKPTEKGGVITIDSATEGFVGYQYADFIATDHVEKLQTKNNERINRYVGLFLTYAISCATAEKYNYGYKFSQNRIKRQTILLPTTKSGKPDWQFMEDYIRERERILIERYRSHVLLRINNN
jgi:hypothetical protein